MARDLRFVPDGALVEVTCRTLHGRFLLRPSDKLAKLIVGILARAARRYEVEICAYVFLSNHCHLLLLPKNAFHLARFMNYVNANVAKEAGRLHGWREKFWGRRYRAIVVSHEGAAQVARLTYLLEQGCKEGLVASPRHWPGANSVRAMSTGSDPRGVWIDRTGQWHARQRGERPNELRFTEREVLKLHPIPCWADLEAHQVQARVRAMVHQIEAATEERHRVNGTAPLGVRAILEQSPHARPDRVDRSPAPRFHAANRQARLELLSAYSWFIAAYREASDVLRRGVRKAEFPTGCFPPPLAYVDT